MSLKENIEMVKTELNSEEQFFEKAVQTERFVKKYKMPLISAVVAIVLVVAGSSVYTIVEQNRVDNANKALNVLMSDATNQEALKQLKELEPKLYDVWSLSQALKTEDQAALAKLQSSDAMVVSDLATYELAALKEDQNALNAYSQKSGALLKDLAMIEDAVLSMQSGDTAAAQSKLMLININSPVYELAQKLAHYGVK